jgi:hypothetical protein
VRHYIVIITFILLSVACLTAVAWFISTPDFEPALTSLALLATITGLFIDRWLAAKERRKELLYALAHELYMNLQVLSDPLFRQDTKLNKVPSVYPRLYIGTLETVIASGAFIQQRDRRLFHFMHLWRQRASEFNRRLDITELRTFMNPTEDEITTFRNLLTGGVVLLETQKVLQDLSTHFTDNYAKESAVGKDTILFSDAEKKNAA